jgi:type IV pilus assembly protein PilB
MAVNFPIRTPWRKQPLVTESWTDPDRPEDGRSGERRRRGRPAPTRVDEKGVPQPHVALGAMLLERQLITEEQLNAAIEQQKKTDRRIGQVLIDMGATTQEAVLGALSVQLGLPGMRVNAYTVDAEALKALPEKVARRHTAFPITKVGTALTVAVATPLDLEAIDDLRFASGCEIRTVVALEDDINTALDRYYQSDGIPHQLEMPPSEEVIVEAPLVERRDPTKGDRRRYGRRATDLIDINPDQFDEAAERSAVTVVDRLLARAAADGASDIHLESTHDAFRVRFRVDGTFRDVATFVPALGPAIIARVKVVSGMDIAEHRLPQDGRFSVSIGTRRLDLRSSTYPTLHGEKAVLRVLDRSMLRLHLETMGMRGRVLNQFRDLIRRAEGLILVTGPTGCGKTSTLYAALTELVETNKHIITIEDPVEYALAGVNQGQTNEKAGFTFARGLRAILRQDPDVIMVGEIRDPETLQTAVEASLTGHLVLSTLHTNSALATMARVMDMGLEPYLLSSSLLGIVAQRLVRRICPTCRTTMPTPSGVAHLFEGNPPDELHRGKGCQDCRGTGYRGRLAIHELVCITEELRHLILERAPESRLMEAAARNGTMFLRDECLARVTEGETTLEEVVRLTQERA